jgi:hypothetical protein
MRGGQAMKSCHERSGGCLRTLSLASTSAPNFTSSCSAASWLSQAATCSGVNPCALDAVGS